MFYSILYLLFGSKKTRKSLYLTNVLSITQTSMATYSVNKKALFDYAILDRFEAGIVLSGPEVKAVRAGHISLGGAFVTFHRTDALLTNAHISAYAPAGKLPDYDPTRSRKLLLKQKEIAYLRGKSQEKGLTIIPLSVYTRGRHIKIEVGIGRGKKQYDKRETVKKRERKREAQRAIKGDL